MRHTLRRWALTAAVLALTAGPALAGSPGPLLAAANAPGYWSRFKGYWSGVFANQSGVALVVVLAGIVSLFIITRGKWRK
jgi:hypothetical protein